MFTIEINKPIKGTAGFVPLPLLLVGLGLLIFFFIGSVVNFKQKLFSSIFPKDFSFAAGVCDSSGLLANPQNGGPVIFNFSETAGPDSTLGLQGDRFGSNPQVWLTVINGTEQSVTPSTQIVTANVLTKSDDYIGIRLPANINNTLYAIWVKDASGKLSNGILVNRARPDQVEFDQLSPNHSFKIYGRNLKLSGTNTPAGLTPEVRLVDVNNPATSLNASVTASDEYRLTVTTPSNIVSGTRYKVMVRNGAGGCWGEDTSEDIVTGRTGGSDIFGLAVPWGADFTFSGNVINVPLGGNIQTAINTANSAGGGVVKLAAGTYTQNFDMKSNVVVQGSGKAATTVNGKIYMGSNTSKLGLMDFKFIATQPVSGDKVVKSFIKNLDYVHNGSSKFIGFNWTNVQHVLWTNNTFDFPAVAHRPFNFESTNNAALGNSYITMRNNTWKYIILRHHFYDVHHIVYENNTVIRDFNLAYDRSDSGGLNLETVKQAAIFDNTFRSIGVVEGANVSEPTAQRQNDGETITTQGASQHRMMFYGQITGVGSNTLTNSSANFNAVGTGNGNRNKVMSTNHVVKIMSGPGMGQWRKVASWTATTVTVDRPWDVTPTVGSNYIISEWDYDQLLLVNNNLIDNYRGIWLWTGGNRGTVSRNTLQNSGIIWFRAVQKFKPGELEVLPIWNNYVADNTVTAVQSDRTAAVEFEIANVNTGTSPDSPLLGTYLILNDVRRNIVDARVPNVTHEFAPNFTDGFWSYYYDEAAHFSNGARDRNAIAILGTIFESNKAIDTANAYQIGTGNFQTIIRGAINQNVTQVVDDNVTSGTSLGSTDTNISLINTAVSPQAVASPTASTSPSPSLIPSPSPVISPSPSPINTSSSTLIIFAAGKTADGAAPNMDILINDQVVKTVTAVAGDADAGTFIQQSYTHPSKINPEMVKIAYTNDTSGSERGLRIDKIVIDGITYQTEATTTLSTGTWNTSCAPGYKLSEWLHCNGSFSYNNLVSTSATPASSVQAKIGDTNGDSKVDIFDYNELLSNFGKTTGFSPNTDLDKNGKIDIFDYNLLLTNLGK